MQRKDGFNHTPIAESVDCSRTTVIVSQETFDRAQEIRQARAARFTKRGNAIQQGIYSPA